VMKKHKYNNKIYRILCCVKKKEQHIGRHICGTTCGSKEDFCTKTGFVTCALSHGGRLWVLFFVSFVWITFGAATLFSLEPETFEDIHSSFYYCVITSATIGYGDFSPRTVPGRTWLFFWGHISIAIFALFSAFLAREIQSCLAIKPRVGSTSRLNQCRLKTYKFQSVFILLFYLSVLCIGALLFQADAQDGAGGYFKNILPVNSTWTFLDSFYFSWVTVTTVGYGDLIIRSYEGRLLAEIYAVFGVAMLGLVLAQATALASKLERLLVKQRRRKQGKYIKMSTIIPNHLPRNIGGPLKNTLNSVYDLEVREKIIFRENFVQVFSKMIAEEEEMIARRGTKDTQEKVSDILPLLHRNSK